MFLSR